ncbi:hypothetical protein [Leptospira interrogans]|uniref:hypothetical protein n=1 Tax=Leptospira interrogans TaxID=173 RepID=UPI001E387E3E|nr:hypothetical protein [Leptospira interrogans]
MEEMKTFTLKEFVKNALVDINEAVKEAGDLGFQLPMNLTEMDRLIPKLKQSTSILLYK